MMVSVTLHKLCSHRDIQLSERLDAATRPLDRLRASPNFSLEGRAVILIMLVSQLPGVHHINRFDVARVIKEQATLRD